MGSGGIDYPNAWCGCRVNHAIIVDSPHSEDVSSVSEFPEEVGELHEEKG